TTETNPSLLSHLRVAGRSPESRFHRVSPDAVHQCHGVALFFHQSECKGEEHGKVSTKNDLNHTRKRSWLASHGRNCVSSKSTNRNRHLRGKIHLRSAEGRLHPGGAGCSGGPLLNQNQRSQQHRTYHHLSQEDNPVKGRASADCTAIQDR